MLYWLTGTITSSTRLYWENLHSDERAPRHISVPTGIARFPKEPIRFPRPWVEAKYDVTHWTEMPRGGHFAAMEQPDCSSTTSGRSSRRALMPSQRQPSSADQLGTGASSAVAMKASASAWRRKPSATAASADSVTAAT